MTPASDLVALLKAANAAGDDHPILGKLEALPDVADEALRDRVCELVKERVENGVPVRTACDRVARREGFSANTVRSWWARRGADAGCSDFFPTRVHTMESARNLESGTQPGVRTA